MGSTDYGEILLSAVNTLIEKSIEDLHFDRTIKCEIIDDRDKKFGKYIVSDGSAKMEAYCDTADKYIVGEWVYVIIPSNDYTQKKIIASKYVENNDAKPIAYVPPLGTFLNMSGNLCNSRSSWGICANSGQIYKQIASIDLINGNYDIAANDTKVCDTIGIAADFKTLFGGVDIHKGNFGLRVDLFTYANKEGKETYDNVVSITFDNTQMFGNPYDYQIPLRQEIKINKGDLLVWGANVYLYQQDNFETQENQPYDSSNILGDNIIVSNVMLSFGQDLLKLKDDNFTISTKDELTYDKENTVKTIYSNWINKDLETNEFIGFSDGVVDLDYDEEAYIKEYANVMQGASIVIAEEDNPIPDTVESLQLYANIKSLTQEVKKIENYFNNNLYIIGILNDLKRNLMAFNIDANTIDGIIDSIGKQFVADNYAQGRLIEIPYINYLQEKFQNHDYKWLNNLTEWENLKIQINSTITDISILYNTLLSGQINNAKTYVESSQNRISNVISKINESLTFIMDRIENANAHLITILDQDAYWNSPNARPFRQRYDDFVKANANRYCIYWYHYIKGYENSNDPFISKDWERIQFDDAVPGMPNIIIEDNEYEKTSSIPYITNSLSMDAVEEKYKAILFFNHNRIDSNELVFTNNKPTSMAIAGDLNNALYIEVGAENSNSMESHQLYNQYYTLLKASDQFINRKIRVRFDGVQGKDEMLVGTQVFWYVPTQATMLRVDDTKLKREGFSLVENNGSDDAKYYRSGYVCYYRNIAGIDTDDTIMPIDADTYFWYQIAPVYNPTLTNNTIICKVIKNNQEYHTEKLFTFSTYGNNGTDYTVSIIPTGNQSAVVKNNDLQLQAIFSDYEGKELDAPSYEWSWQGPSYFTQIVDNEHPEIIKVVLDENAPSNFCLYNIVKVSIPWDKINATVGANETLNLVGLRAIPYAASADYYIQGASTIIYNDLGVNPQYENMPYKIFNAANDGVEMIDVTWELIHYTEDGEEYSPTAKDFVPSIYTNKSSTEYYLKPSTMYVVDQSIYSVAVCKQGDIILYAQPIYIGQNRYSSPMLNSWDESLQIDETNNTVMSAMMGAGYKDNLNRFNGVLMGNVGPKAQIDSIINAGIYGFNEGAQSFAWKVDGTGFIGKSGKGRIEFDGNNGVIYSQGWKNNLGEWVNSPLGTKLDLANGELLMNGSGGHFFKFNENGDGALKMSLSGANINLSDKGTGLSGYIDATAHDIVTELRRTASYYATCETGSSANKNENGNWIDNTENATKIAVIGNANFGDSYENTANDTDYSVSALTIDSIVKDGVTIAVSFEEAEHVKEVITTTSDTTNPYLDSDQSPYTGVTVRRTGNALILRIQVGNDKIDAPIYYKGQPTGTNNPFGWTKGATIYFTCRKNNTVTYWEISDSGSYSNSVITADTIYNEVSNIGDSLSSAIKQTAGSITSEVRNYAGYYGICTDGNETGDLIEEVRTVTLKNAPTKDFNINNLLHEGVGLAVKFTKKNNTSRTIKLNIRTNEDVNAAFTGSKAIRFEDGTKHYEWTEYSTLYFVYTIINGVGYWQITDSGNYSKITQTAEEIRSEVIQKIQHHFTTEALTPGKIDQADAYWIEVDCTHCPLIVADGNEPENLLFDIKFNINPPEEKITNLKIRFNHIDSNKQRVYGVADISSDNPFTFAKNDILTYIIKNIDNTLLAVPTSISSSQILQLADKITAGVVRQEDGDTESFHWQLLYDGFKLYNKKNNVETVLFDCNNDGLTLRPKTFDLVTDSFKINSTGDPYYLQVTHNNTNVLNITGGIDSIFQMQSLPIDPQLNQSVYYVISTWDKGANVRHGGFNEDRTKIAWVDSTSETPVVNYPKDSLIAVTTKNPYKYRSSELWYETIDGYFICCRGSTWEDGGAYVYLNVKNKEGGVGPQTGYNVPTDPLYYNAYSGTWDISTANEKMFIDIQQGKIEIGSNAMKGINCKDENGLLVEEFKTFDQGAKSLYLGIGEFSPFTIGPLYVDWDGRIGSKKLKNDGTTWSNQWYIQPNGGASFSWLWTSHINCNSLTVDGRSVHPSNFYSYASGNALQTLYAALRDRVTVLEGKIS